MQEYNRLHIAIWAVAEIYGGVQILIFRFVKYLHDNDIKYTVIIKNDTRLSRDLEWANCVNYNDIQLHDICFTHLFLPHISILRENIPWTIFSNSYLSCWIVHPTEVFTAFYPRTEKILKLLGINYFKLIKLLFNKTSRHLNYILHKISKNDGIFVMDGATKRSLKYFYPHIKDDIYIVQIPTEIVEPIISNSKYHLNNSNLSIGYLGRMDEFKFSALGSFIKHSMSELAKDKNIEFHIISEGEYIDRVKSLCLEYDIKIFDYGFQPNSIAKEILKKKTDFCVAMGTASLDIASVGHPCIIIDPSHHRNAKPQTRFRFVHEISDYTLGEYRDFEQYIAGKHSIFEIIKHVKEDNNINKKEYDYVKLHHNSESVFKKLTDQIMKSKIKINDIEHDLIIFRNIFKKSQKLINYILLTYDLIHRKKSAI